MSYWEPMGLDRPYGGLIFWLPMGEVIKDIAGLDIFRNFHACICEDPSLKIFFFLFFFFKSQIA